MTSEERDLITGLFDRLRRADTQQRDAEADGLIQQSVSAQPGAPYLLVQTLLVQEHALVNAQARIKELERQVAAAAAARPPAPAQSGGFLAGLFGGGTAAPTAGNIPPQSLPAAAPVGYNTPYPSTVNLPASAGGGFLRSALSTAAGVAGGAMLFEGIESLLGHRSGAFGSVLGSGGGGFMDTGFGGRPEIIETTNNYYETPAGTETKERNDDPGLQNAPDYQNADYTPAADDNSFLNNNPDFDSPAADLPDDSSTNFNDDGVDSSSGDFGSDDNSGLV